MNIEVLVLKYIASTEKVLKEMQQIESSITVAKENINNVLNYVTAYLEDAKYYKAQQKFETSLTSVAYCEGLLDALRLLGAVKFKWPTKTERKK